MDSLRTILKFGVICAIGVGVSALNLKLANLKCEVLNKSYGQFTKCNIKAVNRDVNELNIYFKLDVKSVNNASIKLRFTKRGPHKYNIIYQYRIDACKFMRNNRRNPFADLTYAIFDLQKYSNLNHTCPYDHDVILDRCRLNTKPMRVLAIAEGEYKIYTTWFIQEVPVAEIDISINIG